MKHRLSPLRLGATLLFPLLLGSCALFGGKKNDGGGGSLTGGGGPSGFLATDHAPLREWLDERFPIRYVSMTPRAVFDHRPLRDYRFETRNLPEEAPSLTFQSPDISRRELLQQIANHWNLKMDLVQDADGRPAAIRVSG